MDSQMTLKLKIAVWQIANPIPGYDSNLFRVDDYGNPMHIMNTANLPPTAGRLTIIYLDLREETTISRYHFLVFYSYIDIQTHSSSSVNIALIPYGTVQLYHALKSPKSFQSYLYGYHH